MLIAIFFLDVPFRLAMAVGDDKAPDRAGPVTTLVIHAIGGPACRGDKVVYSDAPGDAKRWKRWFQGQRNLSVHYVIDREGRVEQALSENKVAWHARGHNKGSIGIELVNRGDGIEAFPRAQIAALTDLVRGIMSRHKAVEPEDVVRHSDIDTRTFECGGRRVALKQDPGPRFPFREFISGLKPRPLFDLGR